MRHTARRTLLSVVLLSATTTLAAQAPRAPHLGRETWYEVIRQKMNPARTNYGEWLDERRQVLLDASIRNPFFWYSFGITLFASLMPVVLLKCVKDSREKDREHARIEADLRNHDRYSREKTKEAIERYNQHIEECNRTMEAAESGNGRPGWGNSALESVKAELQHVVAQLEATTQDRDKFQEELRQKSLVVADLSMRLDLLSKKANGSRSFGAATGETIPTDATGDGARLVGHINRLQEDLYAERQKNKRLKGA